MNAVRSCGNWPAPTRFASDAIWNFEAGSKLRLAGDRLQLDASTFRIRWTGIQDYVDDPCGNTYILNASDAISTGADLDAALVLAHWRLALGVERLRTWYTNSVIDGMGKLVTLEGPSSAPGAMPRHPGRCGCPRDTTGSARAIRRASP